MNILAGHLVNLLNLTYQVTYLNVLFLMYFTTFYTLLFYVIIKIKQFRDIAVHFFINLLTSTRALTKGHVLIELTFGFHILVATCYTTLVTPT